MWNAILWTLFILITAWLIYEARQSVLSPTGGALAGATTARSERRKAQKIIGEWLKKRKIVFEEDVPLAESLYEPPHRPNFVLRDRQIMIEFFGAAEDPNTVLYRQKKDKIFEEKGWRVVKLTPGDLDRLNSVLAPLSELREVGAHS